mmetsp:Transcript_15616/g.35887  ORF Transcript_15616/g.35887 Transcript_15616/m.35887 type:complete len:133 (+) Transcript_15616:43-441(+)
MQFGLFSSFESTLRRGHFLAGLGQSRWHFKFKKPPSPNLDALRKVMTERLTPVHFFLRVDLNFGRISAWDRHFKGICCSPKFEGKTFAEINTMVEECCKEVGMEGRVRMICQPPSRWHMMRRRARRRWDLDF